MCLGWNFWVAVAMGERGESGKQGKEEEEETLGSWRGYMPIDCLYRRGTCSVVTEKRDIRSPNSRPILGKSRTRGPRN